MEESKVFSLFQISLEHYFELKAALLKYARCQPSEVEQMPFYEVETLLDNLKALSEKEEEERNKKDKRESGKTPDLNMNSALRQMKAGLPTMPNFKL